MGMAASQARYLALVARKSNCEYEGQQINQARTALSNQSANLFNQMLGLNVPIPPSTSDFTKTQYSFTDGINAYTIDTWNQLATPEEEFNYAVTYHYETDVYTGSQKQMADPQVQFSQGFTAQMADTQSVINKVTSTRIEYDKIAEEYEKLKENNESAEKAANEAIEAYDAAIQAQTEARAAQTEAMTALSDANKKLTDYKATANYTNLEKAKNDAKTALDTATTNKTTLANYKIGDFAVNSNNKNGDGITFNFDGTVYENYSKITDTTVITQIQTAVNELMANGALSPAFDLNDVFYDKTGDRIAFRTDLAKALASSTNTTIPIFSIENAETQDSILNKSTTLKTAETTAQTAYNQAEYAFSIVEAEAQALEADVKEKQATYDNATLVLSEASANVVTAATNKLTAETNLAKASTELETADALYGSTVKAYEQASAELKSYQTPSYIGNCELTLLENLTSDQQAELKQIIATMTEEEINPAINNCFDKDGNYKGGVYQFKLNGNLYYTCFEDLYESYESGTGINHIDGQTKLSYYNASYVPTRIEETEKALLQTDEYGRFVSVRFGDDSITYTLKMETVTDDVAYEDAMNKYYYENAVYDKMVQDINAKTSIIQHEDQQLELRLKQLDTEQNALSTEMEAVQKVVKDNVEKSFKTFSG